MLQAISRVPFPVGRYLRVGVASHRAQVHPPEWHLSPVSTSEPWLYDIVTAQPLGNPLREWWHQILRHYDRYPSYAVILALPSDIEALQYLKRFGRELHLITGKNCSVITLTKLGLMQYGLGDEILPLIVDEHVLEGYCLQVARLFDVGFDEFPCLLLFRDIRQTEHIRISFKGLSAEEIAQEMRIVFSVVDRAVRQCKDPLESIEKHNKRKAISKNTKAVWSNIQSLAGKTLEKMIEVLVETSIK